MVRIFSFILMLMIITAIASGDTKRAMSHIAICSLPPRYGRCKGFTRMWYFSPEMKICRPFNYSTCGGNRNRFFKKATCQRFCRSVYSDNNIWQ